MRTLTKEEVRKSARRRRAEMQAAQHEKLSQLIAGYAFSYAQAHFAKTVFIYAAADGEPETKGLITKLLQSGCTVCLPRCEGKGVMHAFGIRDASDLQPGRYGILAPSDTHFILPDAIDLAFVPGCAFGRDGSRVGYGGGYYDRFLPSCRFARYVGLCFETCLTEALPREETDVCMHALITEKGVMNIL